MTTVVRVAAGLLGGVVEDGVHAFKGIPFAAPLDGPRRFRPPQRPAPWDGVRDASQYGPVPAFEPMPGLYGELSGPRQPAGDDCLSLNVWTPDPGAAGLPVLVWITGGGFYAGAGSNDVYDGTAFARDGVVAVTVNYRLGFVGFGHLDTLFPQLEETGNLGLLDQVAALEWVRDNIAAFGGDPAKVTVAGESAGGAAVAALLATPRTEGLFRGAVVQSPHYAAHIGVSATAAAGIAEQLLAEVGVRPGDLDALLALTPEALVKAQNAMRMQLWSTRDLDRFGADAVATLLAFQPTYGTAVLPEQPIAAIRAGCAADVALLAGTNREEALSFVADIREAFTEPLVRAGIEGAFGAAGIDADTVLQRYRTARPDAAVHELAAAVETDRLYRIPTLRLADAQAAHNPNTWVYEFAWRSPVRGGELGACHYLEVPFVFDRLDNDEARGYAGDTPPRDLAAAVHGAWVSFVATGDPNGPRLPEWPRHDPATRPVLVFDTEANGGVTVAADPAGDERALWDAVI
ncbi:carboxylesterase family protein [Dactylosporangium sp. AC04546]|uniref:carboxylesterase/lipase family protein n=1 Tax=Dactylosporangium sp. AC04546 TaxID=2862460 RepID=UPI001EDFB6F4|nr:carboxylesterase family protein [Dactylosporangium sp. AC04546]WVK88778.1 carboxylesterase family protein [Dactylosporangium sp. AC04546]